VWRISAEQLFSTVKSRTAHCNGRFLFPCTSTDENDENCVAANMYTVFWFNKQIEFDIFFFFLIIY